MRMGSAARKGRRGVAGIVAIVIIFAILFTVGTSYFIFVNSENAAYVQSLLGATNKVQGSLNEGISVTTLLEADGDVGFFANDTSSVTVNMTAILVISSTGALLQCDGVGFPAGAGCTNTTPTLWMTIDAGRGSVKIDTNYLYATGTTDTVKVLTARGNTYTQTYPEPASQSGSSQSVAVNLDNLKWVQLIPQASSLAQKNYVSNCNAASCALAYTSSVTAGNILVDGIGWANHAPPSTPTDTRGDSFTLGASSSVGVPSTPAMVQDKYTSNCNAASCGLAFSSNVASGNTLAYAVGWANHATPSAPTDTRGDSFTLGASQSVTVNPATPAVIQHRYATNCNSATCALAYSSTVTAGNTLVYGLGWPSSQQYNYVPVTITNCPSVTPTIALDGSNTGSFSGSQSGSLTLTTTNSNDVIIVVVANEHNGGFSSRTVSSVTSTGLTFTQRSSATVGSVYLDVEVWYAIASSALSSASITVNLSGTADDASIVAFGVSGANTGSPWDANGALPAVATSTFSAVPTVTGVSTSNANAMLLGFEGAYAATSSNAESNGAGFTMIGTQSNTGGTYSSQASAEQKIVSATQSSISVAFSASNSNWVMLGDALKQGTPSGCGGIPALDGSAGNGTENSSISASITTTNTNDVIVLFAGTSSSSTTVSSVSDTGGHSWSHRVTKTGSPSVEEEEWYTTAATALSSDSIRVQWSATGDNAFTAFGIGGANTAAPFDTNGALPAAATGSGTPGPSPSVSVSTTNANDFIVGMLANEHTSAAVCHTETYGTGFTEFLAESALGSSTCMNSDEEYQAVSATQSGLAIPFTTSTGGSNQWAEIGDAIQSAPPTATPNPFQQMVTWDPATYSSNEATNLGNVRFCADSACNTPLDAWLESCSSTCSSGGSTSTSATAWVKLTSSIAGNGGTLTMYMVFEGLAVNFDGNYWGEAPQLSGTYAQYDNGANVFTDYWNFSGTSCPTGWTCSGTTINNGLSAASAASYAYTTATYGLTSMVLDFYGSMPIGTSTHNAGFGYVHDTPNGPDVTWTINDNTGGFGCGSTSDCLQTGQTSSTYYYLTGLTTTGTQVYSIYWGSTASATASYGYTNSATSYTDIPTSALSLGIYNAQGAQATIGPFNWLRDRAYPPIGIMPTISFGSPASGTGSPTSVADTLGDSFTLGVSQSAVSGSTAYESSIWYATAASSGSDTITATFTASIAGSVSIYEIAGYSTAAVLSSSGSSTGGSTSAGVGSFTPNANSFAVGNVETGSSSTKYTVGAGYTTVASGAGGCDASDASQGCDEYQTGLGSATTTPFTLSASTPWADVAVSFTPLTSNTYYSYVWYATAASSGADTIAASFGSTVAGSVSIYEISGVTATGLLTSTGSSTTSQSATSVTSMTPGAGSVVLGNAETTSTTYTAGGGYTLSGSCSSVAGCGEYQTGVGSATTVPLTISPSAAWVEVALAFAPIVTTYYSYVWYAIAATSGADTITAAFGTTVAGSVSIYEITGFTTSGALSSTGSSSSGSTTAAVASFTPASDSFIVGNAEAASAVTYTAASGYALVGSCSSVNGCSQYVAGGGGSATTVPLTLSGSTGWVESAMSFSTPFNPQSGIQVGGYPTMGVPSGASLVWEVTFTDVDSLHRAITIWPQTEMAIGSAEFDGFDTDYTQAHYYIIDGLNAGSTTLNAYTSTASQFLTLPYGVPTTLYFAATAALGSTTQAFGTNVLTPFEAYFALTGAFSDGSLFGETIPYPYGIITQANAYTTPTAGATANTVTVSCTSPCYFTANTKALVGWINAAGQFTQLTTFTTTAGGNVPAGVTFAVPTAAAGYYTIEVTDYTNSVFMTFQHT